MNSCHPVYKVLLSLMLVALLAACDAARLALTGTPRIQPEPPVLHIYNWPDYVPQGMLANFEKETGIKVVYDIFDTDEALQARLLAGQTGHDIVVPSTSFAQQQWQQGLFQPLNKSLLPSWEQLDPAILKLIALADPGNRYLVPWAWSFSTVGINRTLVQKALGTVALPDDGWALVFNPTYTRRLRSCGIAFLDSPAEVMPPALHHLGLDPFSEREADHQAAAAMLTRIRPDIRRFSSSLIDDLAAGRICAVIGWAGDITIAAERARERGSRDVIEVLLPSTGSLAFFDTMAIPADAPHPQNAHKFIEFYLRPENAAQMANELGYHTGNRGARALATPAVASNPAIFMSAAHIGQLIVPTRHLSDQASESLEHLFENFRDTPVQRTH